jgi:uncharacterized integral membrane protein
MCKTDVKKSFKEVLKRGITIWLLAGFFFAISQDKVVLDYFLKAKTIIQILFFTIVGGLLYSWITYKIINKNKNKN